MHVHNHLWVNSSLTSDLARCFCALTYCFKKMQKVLQMQAACSSPGRKGTSFLPLFRWTLNPLRDGRSWRSGCSQQVLAWQARYRWSKPQLCCLYKSTWKRLTVVLLFTLSWPICFAPWRCFWTNAKLMVLGEERAVSKERWRTGRLEAKVCSEFCGQTGTHDRRLYFMGLVGWKPQGPKVGLKPPAQTAGGLFVPQKSYGGVMLVPLKKGVWCLPARAWKDMDWKVGKAKKNNSSY